MTATQNEDGFAHWAYYRADKGLSFTWNGTKGNVLDVAYGGYGEPVFATLGLGFDPNVNTVPQAFARMQREADRAADTFVIEFWEKAIELAQQGKGPGAAAELPDIPLALAGYHGADEVAAAGFASTLIYDRSAGMWRLAVAAGFAAAGFTGSPEQREIDGDRHCEARVGARLIRHAAAHGHVVRDLDFLIEIYRDARLRFPRGGGEENTDIGRLGATIASFSSKPDWVA